MKKLPAMCVGWWVVCAGLLISGKETLFEGDGKPVKLSEVGAGEGPAWHPEYGLFCSGEGHIMRFPLGAEDAPEVFFRDAGSNGLFFTSTEPGERPGSVAQNREIRPGTKDGNS